MKKIIFIALTDINDLANGVTLKVRSQIHAFKTLGYDVTVATYDFDYILIETSHELWRLPSKKRRKDLFHNIELHIKDYAYDLLYLRLPHFDYMTMSMLKKVKNKDIPVYLEIPSYPIQYKKRSKSDLYFKFFDYLNRHRIHHYITRIFSVGEPTDSIFGVPNVSIPNGYLHDNYPVESFSCNQNDINILSVTHFYEAHGIDRLIEGLKLYSKNPNPTIKVHLHLVGDGPLKQAIVNRVTMYNINELVTFYPPMTHEDMRDLYRIINMGCGPLGVHRMHGVYASPLKTKDYFLHGIPYFCAHEEIGVDSNYPYILKMPMDESPISIADIISFYQSYQPFCKQVQLNMIEYGKDKFSWVNIYKNAFK